MTEKKKYKITIGRQGSDTTLFPVAYDERFEIFNSPSGEPVVVMGSLNHLTKAAKLVLAKEIERKLNK